MVQLDRITIQSRLAYLADVRNFVHELVTKLPGIELSDHRAFWIALAANEVAANIIIHAYQHNPDEVIEIEAHWSSATLVLKFHDGGIPFDFKAVSQSRADRFSGNGFGIAIIKNVTDAFQYKRRADGKNETTLTFRFKGAVTNGG